MSSGAFWWFLKVSGLFCWIRVHAGVCSGGFLWVLLFWCVLVGYGGFGWVIMSSCGFWWVVVGPGGFREPETFFRKGFWWFLVRSGAS
jgi:hypothetical protein